MFVIELQNPESWGYELLDGGVFSTEIQAIKAMEKYQKEYPTWRLQVTELHWEKPRTWRVSGWCTEEMDNVWLSDLLTEEEAKALAKQDFIHKDEVTAVNLDENCLIFVGDERNKLSSLVSNSDALTVGEAIVVSRSRFKAADQDSDYPMDAIHGNRWKYVLVFNPDDIDESMDVYGVR